MYLTPTAILTIYRIRRGLSTNINGLLKQMFIVSVKSCKRISVKQWAIGQWTYDHRRRARKHVHSPLYSYTYMMQDCVPRQCAQTNLSILQFPPAIINLIDIKYLLSERIYEPTSFNSLNHRLTFE